MARDRNGHIKKKQSKSKRAGITFPVARVRNQMKIAFEGHRLGVGAAIYMATVLEYLVAEVLEIAGHAAKDNRKKRVIPRHITLAVRSDEELKALFKNVTIAQGGVLPFIHGVLLPKRTVRRTQ